MTTTEADRTTDELTDDEILQAAIDDGRQLLDTIGPLTWKELREYAIRYHGRQWLEDFDTKLEPLAQWLADDVGDEMLELAIVLEDRGIPLAQRPDCKCDSCSYWRAERRHRSYLRQKRNRRIAASEKVYYTRSELAELR